MRPFRTLVLAASALPAAAVAQEERLPHWKIDPYTENRPELIERAGYVSYGPFQFGNLGENPVSSEHIEEHLHYARILWVETEHFRIGSNLPAWAVPTDAHTRNKLRAELERLAEKLQRINPKTRRLDPWLRLHLFAQRVEDVYDEFSEMAGVKDEDFPQSIEEFVIRPGATYMGQGPYLGMKEKYLLFLTEKEGTYQDYMKSYLGRASKFGQRWHFREVGSLLYTVSTESEGGRLRHDTALHCNVAFNIAQNLLDGFRHYSYDLPVWIRESLGHWFERRVDPKWNSFDQNEGSPLQARPAWKWEPLTHKLLGNGKYAPFSEAYTWRDFGKITFNDHVALWSRMDFLLSKGNEKWRKFLFAVKGRVNEKWLPDQSDLVGATRDALQDVYGISVLTFDERWAEWVKENYSTQ